MCWNCEFTEASCFLWLKRKCSKSFYKNYFGNVRTNVIPKSMASRIMEIGRRTNMETIAESKMYHFPAMISIPRIVTLLIRPGQDYPCSSTATDDKYLMSTACLNRTHNAIQLQSLTSLAGGWRMPSYTIRNILHKVFLYCNTYLRFSLKSPDDIFWTPLLVSPTEVLVQLELLWFPTFYSLPL